MKEIKINKIVNKEIAEVQAQCCCQITGKSTVYESDSCCLADCSHWFSANDAVNTVFH